MKKGSDFVNEPKLKLALIFGGVSSEHEVSCMSAASILRNLSADRYEVYKLGISKQGRWLLCEGDIDNIEKADWEGDGCTPAILSPDSSGQLIIFEESGPKFVNIDVLFPVLHGKNGEDGSIQGLFQLCGIPFVGCDTLASAVCMDKAITHALLTAANIPQTQYLWFYADRFEKAPDIILNKIEARLTFPVFVKPARSGSSVGVSKVMGTEELEAAILKAAKEDSKIVVENGVVGQEVECAVLGNREPKASGVGEIAATAEFYDYDDKYVTGTSQCIIPARLPSQTMEDIRAMAIKAFRFLGCKGLSRVDFFVTPDNKIILNEINTLPGFTAISMYPKLWMAEGMSYSDLLDEMITAAREV